MNGTLYIITGAAGHLAEAILRVLNGTDCQIRGLLLPGERGFPGDNVTYITGDVTEPSTLDPLFENTGDANVIVIHCAGIVSIQRKVSPEVYRVNVTGTKNVIGKCLQYGVHRLVYVSSVHALPEKKGTVIREADHFSPDTVEGTYAKTKAEATQAVMDAAKKGLDAVIVHPSGIIGPYDRYGGNHMVHMMELYLKRRLPAGVQGGYDFVDVRDVAGGVLLAAEKGRPGECYILSNRYITLREIFEEMRVCTGRWGRSPMIPQKAARIIAPICEWWARMARKRTIMTAYSVETLSSQVRFSHQKATAELGYRTRSLSDTVRNTLADLNRNMKERRPEMV